MDKNMPSKNVKIVNTQSSLKNGQIKCPKCGATDIQTNAKTGKLRCNFCRYEFELEIIKEDINIKDLKGTSIGGGAKDIVENSEDIITLKCESCGAEVVINTASSTQARCHWCRNTLSINKQVSNGAIPDMVLPFKVTKEDARSKIESFVNKRKFFAHPTFIQEFNIENVCGVYFPYMVVDVNAHMTLSGEGEIMTDSYTVKSGKIEKIVYDADVYNVKRDFDIAIDDLTIESSSDKLNYSSKTNTNNIINSILPFDTENCVKYNANYLRGYTSEKRDMNVSDLNPVVKAQSSDVARIAATNTIEQYDRGVRWNSEDFTVKGSSWKSAYLPVWLYSYMQNKGSSNLMHYVALNARTSETMGSIPINISKLLIFSVLVEFFSGLVAFLSGVIFDIDSDYRWLLLLTGFAFYFIMYLRYRNFDVRHSYENETKYLISNLEKEDVFERHLRHVNNSSIRGENSTKLIYKLR